MQVANLLRLFPKKLAELTDAELRMAAGALNISLDPRGDGLDELRQAAMKLLQGEKIDTVADLVQSPTSIKKLMGFFADQTTPAPKIEQLCQCPLCQGFFLQQFSKE